MTVVTGLGARLKAQAYGVGFDLAGIVRLGPSRTFAHYAEWVAAGHAGEMGYMTRSSHGRADPRAHLPAARSALVVALDYGGRQEAGPVARYARGDDYHDVLLAKLRELESWLHAEARGGPGGAGGAGGAGADVWTRSYVDTGPFLERDLAREAGLGWHGKNTMLINPKIGSFIVLGTLFTALELEADEPFEADRCGTCTRCLDACPTGAFVGPRELDARRCISYLTIELRGAIPDELRAAMGEHVFGCDVCQDVCPWNVRFASGLSDNSPFAAREATREPDPRQNARALMSLSPSEFAVAFKNSPLKRAKLHGLQRNAAVVLGNVGTSEDIPLLLSARDEGDAVVSEHAAWALAAISARNNGAH